MSQRLLTATLCALIALSALFFVGGCGSNNGSDDVILAEVGDREVTADYYKTRLSRMQEDQLPVNDDGKIIDTGSMEGKLRFMSIIVDKELMVSKALQLGYDQDTQVVMATNSLIEYHAMGRFWQDEIGDPSKFVSDEDLEYYYSRLGERRDCDFIITDYKVDAEAAREASMGGMSWAEIVAKYHSAPEHTSREPKISVPWGQYRDEFERPVFDVEVGGVTVPIETEHGWWVLKVNDVVMEEKPELEAIKGKVLLSISKRNENLTREDLKARMRDEHNYFLDEEVLRMVFDSLPEGEQVIDPATNQPTPQENLRMLDVNSSHYDDVLLSYDLSTGPVTITVADFKGKFDKQNVFERPKQSEFLGGLRVKMRNDAERAIMIDESRVRGYFEDPRVRKEAFGRIEEMLVDRLHKEVVVFDDYISPEALQAFWDEHHAQYAKPERRSGHMVICKDEATALEAYNGIESGEMNWKQVNKTFGSDPQLEQILGRVDRIREDATGPVRDDLYSMEIGELRGPQANGNQWYVIQLDKIFPPETPALTDDNMNEIVGQRMKNMRQDEALRLLLDEWRGEFGVTIHEDRLAEMPSWQEAVDAAAQAKLTVQ